MNAPSSTLRHETLADGLALTFDDRGTGPAVLVLHGGGGPLRSPASSRRSPPTPA